MIREKLKSDIEAQLKFDVAMAFFRFGMYAEQANEAIAALLDGRSPTSEICDEWALVAGERYGLHYDPEDVRYFFSVHYKR